MAVNESRESGLPTVEAAFADAAQAERAVAQLQQHDIDADRIDVQHGGTDQPGRTAGKDRAVADRMGGSWLAGGSIGLVAGVVLGAVIGGLVSGWGTAMFWGLVIGLGAALHVIGGLWGLMGGFSGRSRARDPQQAPAVPDAVRVIVRTKPGEHDTVLRILREKGGAD
jgi:hypothetical protein